MLPLNYAILDYQNIELPCFHYNGSTGVSFLLQQCLSLDDFSEYWTFRLLCFWTIRLLDIRTIGPSDYWAFRLLGLRTIRPLDYWAFGLSDLWTIGPSDYRADTRFLLKMTCFISRCTSFCNRHMEVLKC
jgi:hypothetical protein